jgi:hypothetical protein
VQNFSEEKLKDFAYARMSLEVHTSALSYLVENPGPNLQTFYDALPDGPEGKNETTLEWEGHAITDSKLRRQRVEKIKKEFLEKLVEI